jgi:hypothetical protein
MNFVHIATNGSDSIYEFLNWSTGRRYFQDSWGQLSDRYKIAIRDYFDRTNEGALKSRKVWSLLKDNRNDSFIKLLKDIKLKQANPLWRFMVKKRLYILMSMAVAVLAVLLTFGVIIAIEKLFPPRNERPAITTPVKQEPPATNKESGTPLAADKNSQDSAKLSDTTNPATNNTTSVQ